LIRYLKITQQLPHYQHIDDRACLDRRNDCFGRISDICKWAVFCLI